MFQHLLSRHSPREAENKRKQNIFRVPFNGPSEGHMCRFSDHLKCAEFHIRTTISAVDLGESHPGRGTPAILRHFDFQEIPEIVCNFAEIPNDPITRSSKKNEHCMFYGFPDSSEKLNTIH